MRTILLAFVFLLPTLFAGAQQLHFDRFDISNGLTQNNINCLEFDTKGNLWIGTLDGLSYYDGYKFTKYKPQNSSAGQLKGSNVSAIGKGMHGDMWIVTHGSGLNFYDAAQKEFRLIDRSLFENIISDEIISIIQTNESLLWIITYYSINVFDIPASKVYSIEVEQELMGGQKISESSIAVFGNNGITQLKFNEKNSTPFEVNSITKETCFGITEFQNIKYALFRNRIAELDNSFHPASVITEISEEESKAFNIESVNAFGVTRNNFWIGGDGYLIRYVLNDSKFQLQEIKYDPLNRFSFKGHVVTSLRVDEIGNLWIGTLKNGINYFNLQNNQFEYFYTDFKQKSNPESSPIRAICKADNGDLWMGFDRNGVGVLTKNGKQHFYADYYGTDGRKSSLNLVRHIFADSQGTIWIGAENNLYYFNKDENRVEIANRKYKLESIGNCYSIKEPEKGVICFSGFNGIQLLDLKNQSHKVIHLDDGGQPVRDIVKDEEGNFWIAKNGIVKVNLKGENKKHYLSETHGLSDNKVYSIFLNGDSLWVGTNSGLNLFSISKEKVIKKYFEEDGLCNNVVYSIYSDKNNNLWLSTNKGISNFIVSEGRFISYLPNDFFMDDAHTQADDGKIFYGGYQGVISFLPEKVEKEEVKLNPALNRFLVFNKEVCAGDTVDGNVILTSALSNTNQIELKYFQNTFSFEFNAYPFEFPNTNRYRYKLAGLQENWTETQDNRLVTYTKLYPGKYSFQVQAASENSDFEDTLEMGLTIIPPFWQTIWFKALLTILVLILIIGFYLARISQIKRRNIWLKTKVDEQTAELKKQNEKIKSISEKLHEADQSKLQFFTNVSHEFRTPLTLIIGQLDRLNVNSKSAIKSIKSNSMRLLRLVNQVIDLRKLEQEKLKLEVSEFDFIPFISDIVDSFESMAAEKNIKIVFSSELEKLMVWMDGSKTEMVVYNLLSNAIKYSNENKLIVVDVSADKNNMRLTITDQGIGINEDDLEKIFDRFYRASGHSVSTGHGIGLSMVKGVTELMHGKIEVKSKVGEGTSFRLSFPLGKDHFTENDFGNRSSAMVYGINEPDTKPEVLFENLNSTSILLVEDNAELSQFMVKLFDNKVTIKTAFNGKEALEVLKSFTPDLIISDIMMPEMDGMTFCEIVKNNSDTSHIPFILLTAKADADTKIDGFELGVDDYIEKPFNSKVLLARVKALLLNKQRIKEQFNNAAQKVPITENISKRDKVFIENINKIIEENYSDVDFKVDILAEKLNMSRASFYRKFSNLTGSSPADYLRKVKLRNAYVALVETDQTIIQVCEHVGFQSLSHFRKCFKEEFDCTPSEVQKRTN